MPIKRQILLFDRFKVFPAVFRSLSRLFRLVIIQTKKPIGPFSEVIFKTKLVFHNVTF